MLCVSRVYKQVFASRHWEVACGRVVLFVHDTEDFHGPGGLCASFSAEEIEDMMIHAGALAQQSRDPLRRNSSDSVLKAIYVTGQSAPIPFPPDATDADPSGNVPPSSGQNEQERMCMRIRSLFTAPFVLVWTFRESKCLDSNVCYGLFTLSVCLCVKVCVNFNIVLIVTQMLTQRMILNPFTGCAFASPFTNTKLDVSVDIDANADVKCKESFRPLLSTARPTPPRSFRFHLISMLCS